MLVERFAEVFGEKGLLEVNPMATSVRSKIQTSQFISYEANGFGFLIYRAARHFSSAGIIQSAAAGELVSTLAAAVYHLATLSESLVVQRNGITFLYDMTDAGWNNSDGDFSTQLMDLLQAFPVKMLPSFLINAPFWIRASYSFVASLTGGPILSAALPGQIPANCLPTFLGGSIQWTDEIAGVRVSAAVKHQPEAARFSFAVDPATPTSGGPADVVATPNNRRPPPMWYAGRATPIATCQQAIKKGKDGDFLIRVTNDGSTAILMVKDKKDIAEFPIDIASGKFLCGKVEHKNLEHVVANLSRIPVQNPKTGRQVQLNRAANFGRVQFDPLSAAPLLERPKAQPDIEKPRLITIERVSPTEMLGLKIFALDDGSRGNRVGAIMEGKAAIRASGLALFDVILEIDGNKCLDGTHTQVMDLLKAAGQVLTMKVVSPAGVPLKTNAEKSADISRMKAAADAQAASAAAAEAPLPALPPLPNSPAKPAGRSKARPAQQKRQAPPPWYAGKTTPLATCIKMVKSGKTGTFLIRVSGDGKRAFLMVNDEKEVAEFVINLEGGKFEFGGRPHRNLEEIVENLKSAAIRGVSGRSITLTKAATMPTKKKKKGTKSAEAAKQQGYAGAVPVQIKAPAGKAPTLTSAQNAGIAVEDEAEVAPAVPPRSSKPRSASTVTVDAFETHVRGLRDNGAVAALFNQVQVDAQENPGTYENATDPENKTKNRYINVHPYDHSRVVLAYPEGTGTGDYINANYVDGYTESREYICCQGPLPNTVQDFWWLVWQEGVETIAMLNKLEENGRKKCEKYWPDVDETIVHGPVSVTGAAAEDAPATDVVKRKFTVAVEGAEPRVVTHYQFTGWPDFGIPNTADGVLDICRIVESSKEEQEGSAAATPTVVHCSAGIGRTGTFCTIDIGRKMIKAESSVDVIGILKKLRTQRSGMVQAKEQLDFCYQALLEHIEMTKFFENGNESSSSD